MFCFNYFENYSPVGDLSVVVICVVILTLLKESYIKATKDYIVFKLGLFFLILCAVIHSMFFSICKNNVIPPILNAIGISIVHISLIWIFSIYAIYIKRVLLSEKKTHSRTIICSNIIGTISIILAPILGIGVDLSNNSIIIDYKCYPFTFIYSFNILFTFSYILIHRYAIIKPIRGSMTVVILVSEFVFWNCLKMKHMSFIIISFLLPFLVILYFAYSNTYDMTSGALNSKSFRVLMSDNRPKDSYFLCLQFDIQRDYQLPEEIGILIKSTWGKFIKRGILFNPITNLFILYILDDDVENKIIKLVNTKFTEHYNKYKIDYKFLLFKDLDFVKSYIEFMEIYDHFEQRLPMNTYKFYYADDYTEITRTQKITKQLKDIYNKFDLDDERVLVYCQPIKDLKSGKYTTAESLMRIQLPELGLIYPNDFIPIVERLGFVHRFSMIMLNKVCKYIKHLETEGYNIARISINFSVQEVKNKNFLGDFRGVVDKNDIPYSKIGVEFTESTTDEDYYILQDMVEALSACGCTMYLDDFGTGYSNFDRILGLNMHIIKFDRSLLLLADNKVSAKYLLSSFSDAFSKMNYKVLYEGIETDEQEDLCRSCNADYLQGYKYSKPIPISQLKDFLERKIEV